VPADYAQFAREHEEALALNERLLVCPELPAHLHLSDVRLVRGGVECSIWTPRRNHRETLVVQPQSLQIWRELLWNTIQLAPDYRLRDLLALVTLPPETSQFVWNVCCGWREGGFHEWFDDPDQTPDPKMEYLEVYGSYWAEREDSFGWGFHGIGVPLTAEDIGPADWMYRVGDRICWAALRPGPYLNHPLRLKQEFAITTEAQEEQYVEMLSRWDRNDGSPKPEYPAVYRGRMVITLREFIEAVFSEFCQPGTRWSNA